MEKHEKGESKSREKKEHLARKVKVEDKSSAKDEYRFKMSGTTKRGVKRYGGQYA